MNTSGSDLGFNTFITTPVEAPGTLALLLPTKGRPSSSERLFNSMKEAALQS